MTEELRQTALENESSALSGKYLTFRLGREEYGLRILRVREIIGLMDITPVPLTPDFVRGVINLRGKVIPVVDLRRKFSLQSIPDTEKTCIIVIDVPRDRASVLVGILVDSVSEVLNIGAEQIEAAPSMGATHRSDYIIGMAKAKESVRILLNIEVILNSENLVSLTGSLSGGETND